MRIKDNESIVCGFYCIAFICLQEMFCEIIDNANLFSLNDLKRMEKHYISILKINMVEEFRLRKIDETRNYL